MEILLSMILLWLCLKLFNVQKALVISEMQVFTESEKYMTVKALASRVGLVDCNILIRFVDLLFSSIESHLF